MNAMALAANKTGWNHHATSPENSRRRSISVLPTAVVFCCGESQAQAKQRCICW